MKPNSILKILLKTAAPTGFLIALTWLVIQITFYQQGWAQAGTTSLPLFVALIICVSFFLYFSFKSLRNKFYGGNISVGRLLLQGLFVGFSVAIFGLALISIYNSYINPEYNSMLDEMYNLSWMQRELTNEEIASQQSTNDFLASPLGLAYGFFFVIFMTIIFSIIPAFLVAKKEDFSDDKWSPEIA